MRGTRQLLIRAGWLLAFFTGIASAQVSVLTQHNDAARTGANLQETILNVSNVNKAHFGKLAYRIVDGNIYAQPLIVARAKISTRAAPTNVAVVATENDSVYAFDADDTQQASTTAQLWKTDLGPSVSSDVLYKDIGYPGCPDLTLQVGVTGTPVIRVSENGSTKTGIVFAAAKSKTGNKYSHTLYALNLSDGTKLGAIAIDGSVHGTGAGSTGTGADARVRFNPLLEHNRPALLLVGNTLYVMFGGHCDTGDYHGWVFAFDVSNPLAIKRVGVYCTTPNGKGPKYNETTVEGEGGIWMSGEGPAADEAGNVYFVAGNGTYNGASDLSDSIIKIGRTGKVLKALDWFTPDDETELKDNDADLGSAGAALLPGSHLLLAEGKEGKLYLVDRNAMGKGAHPPLQSFQVTHPPDLTHGPAIFYNIHGTPVIWARGDQMYVYLMGEEDRLKQFRLTPDSSAAGWKFEATDPPFPKSDISAPYPNFPVGEFDRPNRDNVWMPGGFLALSANGITDGTGILWVAMPYAANANHNVVRGILRAFDMPESSRRCSRSSSF